jgi:hypothetical protein
VRPDRERWYRGPSGRRRLAEVPAGERLRKPRIPDLSGKTFGTWRVLYEAEVEEKRHYMCRCGGCGVKKIILAIKLWKGYALRCRECKIRQELLREIAET